jgi:(p)ppGpp synthase/HD superfamily hydrolase
VVAWGLVVKPTPSVVLGARYVDAVRFAVEVHAGDDRKGADVPYASHLLAVSSLVLEDGGGEDEAIAGLLHDVVEDHGIERLAEVRDRFGDVVGDIVVACSDSLVPDGEPKAPWLVRKEAYVAELRLETTPEEALVVSCADKLHNARSILADLRDQGLPSLGRFSAEPPQLLWYYESLALIFEQRLAHRRNQALLREVVDELRSIIEAGERVPA